MTEFSAFNRNLEKIFNSIDKDDTKTIRIEDLAKALRAAGLNPTESQIEELSNNCILISDKFLDYKEFQRLAYSCRASANITTDEVRNYFAGFDKEKKGFLTIDELKDALCSNGDKLTKSEIEVLVRDFDEDGSGRISISVLAEGLFSGCFND